MPASGATGKPVRMRIRPRRWIATTLAGVALTSLANTAAAQNAGPGQAPSSALTDRDVAIREVSYADVSGASTEATLVTPAAPGRYPAVLFVHWFGPEHTTSNRTQYVPDALALARHGIVSLLIDTPWSDPMWFRTRKPDDDVTFSTDEVKRLQRALDVLAASDRVDPSRLALVGHDFGAMYGAIIAAMDRRVTAFAFIAGTSRFADWFTLGRKLDADARARVYSDLARFDPVAHMGKIGARSVLLQFAANDRFVTAEAASALIAAVTAPKESKTYECGHEMNRQAMEDRVAWLVRSLGRKADAALQDSSARARAEVRRAVPAGPRLTGRDQNR